MKKRILSLLCVLALCLGLLPVTALAEGTAPQTLYVGSTTISAGYWTSSDGGTTWAHQENQPEGNNYIYYDGQGTLKLHNATIQGGSTTESPFGSGIYALCSSNQSVALTIELIGTNTITGNYGIYVDAQQGGTVGTNASLLIQNSDDDGSLEVSGSSYGIYVKSGTGDASLTIKNASVDAKTTQIYSSYAGVCVQSGSDATSSPQLSLAVNGGSLTASASEGNDGIQFYVGSSKATGATTSLTVSDNAIVDARNGGISASRILETLPTPTPTGNNRSGIVFDGKNGTVYGTVELQNDLTINEGETLTVPDGSSLSCNGNLTNNGTINVESGGTVTGKLKGSANDIQTPSITAQPTGQTVTEGSAAMFSVTASNAQTYQWQQSTDNGSSWANIESATSASYTISSTATDMSNYQYRCVVKSASGVGVISNAATLTVTEKTEPTTYTISTAEQLYAFAEAVNTGNTTANAILTADIDLGNKAWTPIGKENAYIYNGTFDGQGHTISRLQCSVSSSDVAGLFGVIGENAVVKNLGVADSDVSVVVTVTDKIAYAGGVCGYSAGTVENCWNSGSVTATCNGSNNDRNAAYAGGVCGWNDGIIRNCWNSGAVKAESTTASCVGGVCGYSNKTVENCWNSGSVSGIVSGTDSKYNVGGVCGYNTGTITNCYWLAGTAEYGIGNPRGDTNAESKTAEQFASGEVAWLLNQGQTGTP